MSAQTTRFLPDASLRDVKPFVGAVAVGRLRLADGYEFGKYRPMILWRRTRPRVWSVIPLTTSSLFADGQPRAEAVGAEWIGLKRGYIWGGVHQIAEGDIQNVVWAAPREMLAAAFAVLRSLPPGEAERLTETVYDQLVADGWYWPKPDCGFDDVGPWKQRNLYRCRPKGAEGPLYVAHTFEDATRRARLLSARDGQTWVVLEPRGFKRRDKVVAQFAAGRPV